ncbi:MAG: amidohydrolase [Anaerolineae bacterium]|nr:amidohydrolase [Anaerolineae bacterium]
MILDVHAHVGVTWPEEGVRPTVADAIGMMDRAGVDMACTSASRYLRCDMREGNRVTLEVVRAYPDRLIGFVILSPRHVEESLTEADRYLGHEGFRGIKVHRSHNNVAYDDSRYDPIYAKGEEYGVPVLAHTFSPAEVQQVVAAARRHPRVSFIVGHSGGYAWADCLADAASVPNTYLDICASCADVGRIEAFVAAVGPERVLYGTDNPFLEPSHCLAQVRAADLTELERDLILGANAARLVGIGR